MRTPSALTLGLLFLAACNPLAPKTSPLVFNGGATDSTSSANLDSLPATYQNLYQHVLEPKCVSCHGQLDTEAGLSAWVTPKAIDQSLLYTSVIDGFMPQGAAQLNSAEIDLIVRYIEQAGGASTGDSSGGSSSGGTVSAPLTYDQLKTTILQPYSCLNCHSDETASETALAQWIDVAHPEESKLYTSVLDGSMPRNGSDLPQAKLDYVLQYINDYVDRKSATTTGGSSGGTTTGGTTTGGTTTGGTTTGGTTTTGGSSGGTTTTGGTSGGVTYITYAQLKTNILTPKNCLNCHNSKAGTEANLINNWVNLQTPENSLLYTRVIDNTMPKGLPDLTAAQKAYILQYIKDYKAQH